MTNSLHLNQSKTVVAKIFLAPSKDFPTLKRQLKLMK